MIHFEGDCLDIKTGEVYYFDRETGTRTSKDPRVAAAAHAYSSSYLSDEEDVSSSDEDRFSGVGSGSSGGDTNEDSVDSTANSCLTCISSASSPAAAPEPLVSAGCRSCFMYFMVPKSDDACPKCGGRLFKLGRHGDA
ncbi:protein CURLY FLAG LEAF 1-like [Curcuma longa]|uniref:protein CURLY FLAG LEAF 1-like n=1 Tax=Curcuma longa TaxID=136217 RepID=UPI003D9F8DEE